MPEARMIVEENTSHNIELIEALSDKALAYEQQGVNFKVVTVAELAAAKED